MRVSTILTAMFLAAPPAGAQEAVMTAGDLLDACTRADESWISFCNGFFQAVHDVSALDGRVCVPVGTTRTDLVLAFERQAAKALAASPPLTSKAAVSFAALLLEAEFPCG